MARPLIEIDPEQVENLAYLGLNETQICAALNVSPDTFRRRKNEEPGLYEAAIGRGRARSVAAVSSALFDKALSGDVRAQIFFLKTRGGWQDPYLFGPQDSPPDAGSVVEILIERLPRLSRTEDTPPIPSDGEAEEA